MEDSFFLPVIDALEGHLSTLRTETTSVSKIEMYAWLIHNDCFGNGYIWVWLNGKRFM